MHMILPRCMICKHYHFVPGRLCDAFPEGVPEDIFHNMIKHDHPIEGDHGIQFEQITREELIAILTQRRAEGAFQRMRDERLRREWEQARQDGRVTGEYQPPQET